MSKRTNDFACKEGDDARQYQSSTADTEVILDDGIRRVRQRPEDHDEISSFIGDDVYNSTTESDSDCESFDDLIRKKILEKMGAKSLIEVLCEPSPSFIPLPTSAAFLPANRRFMVSEVGSLHIPLFRWFGRSKLEELIKEVNKRISNLEAGLLMTGNIGAGKSHLLAAYAIYLHCLRILKVEKAYRVVYLASSSSVSDQITSYVLNALRLTFPEEDFSTCPVDDMQAHSWIDNFLSSQSKRSIVFIYDDWNGFEDFLTGKKQDEYINAVARWLRGIAVGQFRIEVAHTDSLVNPFSSRCELAEYSLFGGISEAEWAQWKSSDHFPLFKSMSAEDEDDLKYYTGLIPLILTRLNQYEVSTLNDAYERFEMDDSVGVGGAWIRGALSEYSNQMIQKNGYSRYYKNMAYAISGQQNGYSYKQYDHRFFYLDGLVLKPIGGYVVYAITDVLGKLDALQKQVEFQKQFNIDWLRSAYNLGNPSLKGFAFKQYCIRLLIQNLGGSNFRVVRFTEDFPQEDQLNDDEVGVTLYWPLQWNVRYIDVVWRIVSKRKFHGVERVTVTIVAGQITLERPTDHSASLNFYTTKHEPDNMVDAKRYELPNPPSNVTYVHQFEWILPERLAKSKLPANPPMLKRGKQIIKTISASNIAL